MGHGLGLREGLAGWELQCWSMWDGTGSTGMVCPWIWGQQKEQDEALGSPEGSLRFSPGWGTHLKGFNTGVLGMCPLPAGTAGKRRKKDF